MKKILLSCVTCLLAVGLLAGCNNEEEDITPNEPETTVPSGDTSEDDEGSSLPVTCKLGALDEENYTYRWFTGAANSSYLATSISWEKGIDVTISDAGSSDDGVTLSFVDEANATKYISWSSSTSVDISDEPYTWYWVEESSIFAAGSTEGRALVLYTNGSIRAYAQNETNLAYPHVMAFSEKPTYPVAPELPDTVAWEDGGTYLFGVNTNGAVRYIDGSTVSGNSYEGGLTTNLTYAVPVTIGKVADSDAYTLSFELEGVTYYITIVTSGNYVNLAYSTEEAYLYWNETYGCWGNEEATHFLCYNSSYSCLYCSALADYDGETPIASTYATVELPAPTELEISGPETVYLGHSAKYSVVVNEGADASVTWSITESDKGTSIDAYGNLTTGSDAEEVTITATSTATDATVDPATITVSIEEEPTIVKLGALDEDYYTYRWLNGGTSSSHATTSMDWEGGVDVYVAAISDDEVDGSCTLSFINSSGELKYISHNDTTSNTNVIFADDPYTWVWDSSSEVFKNTADSARYLGLYTNGTIRAYTFSDTYDAYPAVKPYQEEPTAPTVPEDYPTLTAAVSLVSGSTYYIGCPAYNGASYIFDGGNYRDQQLTASVQPTSFVAVTATGSDTDGWTFTFTLTEIDEGQQDQEVEYTLYSYMSNGYCEISAVASSSLEETLSAEDLVASSTFGWDSTHYGITVTLGETTYFLAQNRNSSYPDEFQMASFETYAASDTWISFYPVPVEA